MNRSDLLFDLVTAQRQLNDATEDAAPSTVSVRDATKRVEWRRRIADRLTEADIRALVAAFLAGTPKRQLAERYEIGMTSVKRLLREHGATKRYR